MSSNDRPKPPRPSPPSDPTIRSRVPSDPSIRAAGLTRPSSPSHHELVANEVKRHGQVLENHEGRLATLEGASGGAMEHADDVRDHLSAQDEATEILFVHLGIEERLPDALRREKTGSDEQPKTKAQKPLMVRTADDSWKAKVAAYVGAAVVIAEGAWKIWTTIHGGK